MKKFHGYKGYYSDIKQANQRRAISFTKQCSLQFKVGKGEDEENTFWKHWRGQDGEITKQWDNTDHRMEMNHTRGHSRKIETDVTVGSVRRHNLRSRADEK